MNIATFNFYSCVSFDNNINKFVLTIYDIDMKSLRLTFSFLDDAVFFTEEYLTKSYNFDELLEIYNFNYKEKVFTI